MSRSVRAGIFHAFATATVCAVVVHANGQLALADGVDWSRAQLNMVGQQPAADTAMTPMIDPATIATWHALAAQVRANQPAWSSPLITTTGMLEQRFRFDLSEQHAGNGANTTVIEAAGAWT